MKGSLRESLLDLDGVVGLLCFSGDLGENEFWPPSIIKLRSRTEPGCKDCMRRCADPLTRARSGDTSLTRLASALDTRELSRAFSVRAACADWMAADVPALEVTLGDCGLSGSGGGALSGSELSHLVLLSFRHREGIAT